MADQPSPQRRFQFRLRTLFVVVTIVAAQCRVCISMYREWQSQEQERLRREEEIFSFTIMGTR
jgi:hypothetical protein